MARVVAVSTNPAVDRIALADGAAAGGVARARELLETPGGKAAHVAMVAGALGADALLVAPAGGANGERLAALLAAEGVPAALVPVAGATRGTYTVVDPEAGDVIEVHEPSPALTAAEAGALVGAAARAAAGAAVVVVAGSLPAGAPAELHAWVVEAARAAGALAVADASTPAALAAALAAEPDLVKPNRAEAAAVTGADGDPVGLARALRERGARAAWVSLGARGSVLADGEGRAWRLGAPVPERAVNAVGCGDALVGGLAAGLARGLDLRAAAVLGAAAAADKLAHLHSGRVERAAVERLARAVDVEPLA